MLSQELRDGINCKVMFKEIRYLSKQMPACWLLSSSINTVMAEYKQDDMLSMHSKFDLPKIYKSLPPNVHKDHILWNQSYFPNEAKC